MQPPHCPTCPWRPAAGRPARAKPAPRRPPSLAMLLVLTTLAACNAKTTDQPRPDQPPAADETATPTAGAAVASGAGEAQTLALPGGPGATPAGSQDDRTAAAASPAPETAPVPFDVRTPRGVITFIAALCERAVARDAQWLTAHVQLPLPGRRVVDEGGGNPRLGAQPRTADQLGGLEICQLPPRGSADIHEHAIDGDRVTAVVSVGQFDQRLTFATDDGGVRLVEVTRDE